MYRYLLIADLINTMIRLWQYKNIQDRYVTFPPRWDKGVSVDSYST